MDRKGALWSHVYPIILLVIDPCSNPLRPGLLLHPYGWLTRQLQLAALVLLLGALVLDVLGLGGLVHLGVVHELLVLPLGGGTRCCLCFDLCFWLVFAVFVI